MSARNSVTIIARGVYWARYTKLGRPICYAVDSRGEIVRRYRVMQDSMVEAAVQSLWDYLDAVDPRPQIRLVQDLSLPDPMRRTPPIEFDPYNLPPLRIVPKR